MQEKSSHSGLNLIIAAAILIALGVAGYLYETRDKVSNADLLVSAPAGAGSAAVEGDLLTALGQLRKLSLDDSVFKDPIFTSLTDYSTELLPQPAGRSNPFAPFSSESSGTAFTVPASAPTPTSTSTTTPQ